MADETSMSYLKKQLEEARERATRAEEDAKRAEVRAERAEGRAKRAEVRAERVEGRAKRAEVLSQPLTLEEYTVACHELLHSRLAIETNPKFTTKGLTTNPRDKWCPKTLKPWPDFIHQQRLIFGILYDNFPRYSQVFESRHFLQILGDRVSLRRIGDEKTLELFMHNSVEDPVRIIIEQLRKISATSKIFEFGNGVIFENHPHALSDMSMEVVEKEISIALPQTPNHRQLRGKLRPDQICVFRSDDTQRTMIYISEYKPPHKLTAEHLRQGLHAMNLYTEVVNRKKVPTSSDPIAQFKYQAEELVASALTQTYNYMIEGGLEYGLLTTGEKTVFLRIDWAEPETLLYHLAEPSLEVPAHPNNIPACTAVGQHLAFTLMALGSRRDHSTPRQERRLAALPHLKTWAKDFEATWRSIPEKQRQPPSGLSSYEPNTYSNVDRSPYLLRERKRLFSQYEADDESYDNAPDTPTPIARLQSEEADRGIEKEKQYCTQKCLLGLVNGGVLDSQCPNVNLHCKSSSPPNKRHPISHKEWLDMLWNQLARSLDDGIKPLNLDGSRGVLFKVTLLAYGYTFVSKATVRAFVDELNHEATVYKRLKKLQGIIVPVFLGSIDLSSMKKIYYYAHRVYLVHMTFLSWGGTDIARTEKTPNMDYASLETKSIQSLEALHQEGVIHTDARLPNMLVNSETNGVMIIDFERSILLEPPRRPLAQLIPRKREWKPDIQGDKEMDGQSRKQKVARRFATEIGEAKCEFLPFK